MTSSNIVRTLDEERAAPAGPRDGLSQLDAETERSIARGMEMANAIDSLFDSLMGAKR